MDRAADHNGRPTVPGVLAVTRANGEPLTTVNAVAPGERVRVYAAGLGEVEGSAQQSSQRPQNRPDFASGFERRRPQQLHLAWF
jgi:hypothetical protein